MGPAVRIVVAAVLTIYIVQIVLGGLVGGLVAAAIGYLLVTFELIWVARTSEISLGLRGAPVRFFVAAVLIGLACWYVDLRLVGAVSPPGNTDKLEKAVSEASLFGSLVSVAMLPAIAEELVFRGVLARGLATRNGFLAIVISAVLFSAYHLSPVQIVGTFPLAIALGTLAVRSGSIVPGMIAHFLNNATVLVLVHVDIPGLAPALEQHPTGALLVATGVLIAGVGLAAKASE